jgi:hypothetical protein
MTKTKTTTTTKTPLPGTLTARALVLAERTADAYSWDNYGEKGWLSAARELLRRKYTERQAEAILRSKWTRWAGDMATNRSSWRYGRTTGADLGRFIDSIEANERVRMVNELEVGTFGSLEEPETLVGDDGEGTTGALLARHAQEGVEPSTAHDYVVGDVLYWRDPDGGRASTWGTVVAVNEGINGDVFTLAVGKGDEVECLVHEVSRTIPAKRYGGKLTVHALCPHCDSDITEIHDDPVCEGEGYDNGHFKGRGGYKLQCASCGEWFHIEKDTVNDVQHLALRLLGEAE